MKKNVKKIIEVGLPAALLLSSAWNACARITTETAQEQITNELENKDVYISENENAESNVFLSVYSCGNSCMSSCGGSCYSTCERSCIGSCGGSCYSTCQGSCRASCGSMSSYGIWW